MFEIAMRGQPRGDFSGRDRLQLNLLGELAHADVVGDLYVRLYLDENRTPIENARKSWDASPRIRVGELRIRKGSANDPTIDRESFNPGNVRADYSAASSLSRARERSYREAASATGRPSAGE
jgi:hypothetical protein